MAGRTVRGGRFFNPHACMTSNALLVIGRHQAWSNRLSFNKRLAVTTTTLGRFLGNNAVVVTPLAKGAGLTMKSECQLAAFNLFLERLHNFAMGHLCFLELIRQNRDIHYFGNLIRRVGGGWFFPGFQHSGGQFVRLLCRPVANRHWLHMAVKARTGISITGKFLIDILVTTGTFRLGFLVVMAADATLRSICLVH